MKSEIIKDLLQKDRIKFGFEHTYICFTTPQGVMPNKVLAIEPEYIVIELGFQAKLNNKMDVNENLSQIIFMDTINEFVRMPEFLAEVIKQKESKVLRPPIAGKIIRPA